MSAYASDVEVVEVVADDSAPQGVTSEQIAARAYEIHLSGEGGDELGDWLRAEQELNAASIREGELEPDADARSTT